MLQAEDDEEPPRGPRSLAGIDDPEGLPPVKRQRPDSEDVGPPPRRFISPTDGVTYDAPLPPRKPPPRPRDEGATTVVAPSLSDRPKQRQQPPAPPSEDQEVRVTRTHIAPASPQPKLALPAVRGTPERDPTEDLLVRSQKGVTLGTMIDELADELAHQLSKEDPKPWSPLAIRLVRLSPNLRPSLRQALEAKIVARLSKLPGVEQVVCVECRAVRSRVEGGDWVVTLGASTQGDLRRIGADIGAKAFLELDLTFNQVPAELTLTGKIYRASDGRVLWAAAYKGDETTAAVLRTGKVPPSREEQLAELKRKLEMRPYWGYMVLLGVAYLQADGPKGGYFGANPGVRVFERFGRERRHMYGIQGEGFLDWQSDHLLLAGMLSAGYWYSILQPNLNRPDLRIGATVGGFIAGNEGNSAILQVMAEYVLQFRLAANIGVMYMAPAKYNGQDLGGFGFAARVAFSW